MEIDQQSMKFILLGVQLPSPLRPIKVKISEDHSLKQSLKKMEMPESDLLICPPPPRKKPDSFMCCCRKVDLFDDLETELPFLRLTKRARK
jgi:hypothetical protein